ncbi:glycosyltransferase family 39 protein [Plantactinospora sp. KLBMP9567]|uniref:glycosyltransferase family 39 protein n=1 Tax=Plantactinospora sp. KLBMP9567 TaxID=3085900 RepID=UPI002982B047|nr:glycosyltransferase family 39 protein [Plantactinospora sp. KLBMP9567]MDW5322297.1 glycosyltransferase family 39 protein [Plantactinospora sp. KLBMP9567]
MVTGAVRLRPGPGASAVPMAGLAVRRPELVVAAGLFGLLIATAGRYGWFIDELYFIRAGAEPAWGYPDQPVFNPVAVHALFTLGDGRLEVVRAVAALASCAAVVVAGSLASLLGGGPVARLLAAGLWAASGTALTTGHLFVTGTFDVLATAVLCWCLVRAGTSADPRWMVPAGMALGLGLTNKMLVGVAAGCLAVAVLLVGPRWLLRSWWTVLGAVPAVLAAAPYVYWQATHGWPQAEVADSIAALAESRPLGQLWGQATMLAAPALPLFLGGLWYVFRAERLRPARTLGVGYLLMLALVMAMRGRGYYTCGMGPALAALGGLAGERWLARGRRATAALRPGSDGTAALRPGSDATAALRPGSDATAALRPGSDATAGSGGGRRSLPWRPAALATMLTVAFVVDVLCCLPVIPVRHLQASGVGRLNPMIVEEVGWPELAGTVSRVWQQIPPADRDQAVVFTTNYSNAGALDVYGAALGLPRAFSGHTGYAQWGPPAGTGPVVLVGFESPAMVSTAFRDCRQAAVVDNGVGLSNNAQGQPVLLCAGTTRPWPELWPALIHYDLGYGRTLPGVRGR